MMNASLKNRVKRLESTLAEKAKPTLGMILRGIENRRRGMSTMTEAAWVEMNRSFWRAMKEYWGPKWYDFPIARRVDPLLAEPTAESAGARPKVLPTSPAYGSGSPPADQPNRAATASQSQSR
jgi:hypothetical protein